AVRKVVQDLVGQGYPIIYLALEGGIPKKELASELGVPLKDGESSNDYISRVVSPKSGVPKLICEQSKKNTENAGPYGFPLTIVLDNVDYLLNNDEEMLVRFQKMIKEYCYTKHREVNVIFVSSDGIAPKFLWSKSVSSRMVEYRLMEATGNIAKE